MTVVEVLERARGLIEAGWTQGAYARDAAGGKCDELSSGAVSYCLLGALRRAAGARMDEVPAEFGKALHLCVRMAWGEGLDSLVAWQDEVGRASVDVVAFLDRVIAGCGR